jgi:hypothetical protein
LKPNVRAKPPRPMTTDATENHDATRCDGSRLRDGLGVRELPPQMPRVETGPTRFGGDWCGVFIRGDSAAYYAMLLRQVLHPTGEDVDAMTGAIARINLRGLLRILEAGDERGHTPNAELTGARPEVC